MSENGNFLTVVGACVEVVELLVDDGIVFFELVGTSTISSDDASNELHGSVDVLILVIGVGLVLSIILIVDAMSKSFEFAFTSVDVEAERGESVAVRVGSVGISNVDVKYCSRPSVVDSTFLCALMSDCSSR